MVRGPVPYEAFRTGLTFNDVYHMIYSRRWKRRRGVLGKWREIKQKMYAEYLFQFYHQEQGNELLRGQEPEFQG